MELCEEPELPDCPMLLPEFPDWPMELSELPELPDCWANADIPAVSTNANASVKSFFMKSEFLCLICGLSSGTLF